MVPPRSGECARLKSFKAPAVAMVQPWGYGEPNTIRWFTGEWNKSGFMVGFAGGPTLDHSAAKA